MAKAKYNWSAIRQEYVMSPETLTKKDLADKYGMAPETLIRKATKEKWDFERGRFIIHLQEQTAEKKSDAVSSFAATWDTKCSDVADKLLAKALAEMVEGFPCKDRKGNVIMNEGKPLLFKATAKEVAAAMKIAQDMGKIASGGKPDGVLEQLVSEIKKALS